MLKNNDIVQYTEALLDKVILCDISIGQVREKIEELISQELQFESLATHFFEHHSTVASRPTSGIVETPKEVVAYMVRLAHSRWLETQKEKAQLHDPHWFDPCGGAGVFPVEILRFYSENLGARNHLEFPKITVSEISSRGVAVSFVNVILTLQSLGVSVDEYINAGKLKFILGDTLDRFQENIDIFSGRGEFDIVIGNPPYVRASRLSKNYKKKISLFFSGLYSGSADLYTYFIAAGIANINPNGILAYITPAAFIRAKSGASLRKWLLRNASLDTFIDLDETKVFEDADLHSAIYVFRKSNDVSKSIQYRHIQTREQLESLIGGRILLENAFIDAPSGAGWAFHSSPNSLEDYSKTFSGCVRMQDLGVKIYSGIRPGFSAAFFIDEEQCERFHQETRKKWVKPLILPSNIKKWSGAKKNHYMIVIPMGVDAVDEEIINFLLPYKDNLIKRAEVKNKEHWYALRSCSYYCEMEKRKIAFPDLSSQQRFSMVGQGVYVPDGAYFIDSDSFVLLGILNSDLAKEYFVHRCSSVGSLKSKGRFRFKKEFVKDFPLPLHALSDGMTQRNIARVVSKIIEKGETDERIHELNKLVKELYQE